MNDVDVLLIHPPTWNAHSPHLAVPLLVGALRRRGFQANGLDLNALYVRHLLSRNGLRRARERIEGALNVSADPYALMIARLLVDSTASEIDLAWASFTSESSSNSSRRRALRVISQALECHSAAFFGFECDLKRDAQFYSPSASADVRLAAGDPELNPYFGVFEELLRGPLEEINVGGVVGISISSFTQVIAACTAASVVREQRPDLFLVFGGNHLTRVVSLKGHAGVFGEFADFIITGEGERTLGDLVENLFNHVGYPEAGLAGCEVLSGQPLSADELGGPCFDGFDATNYLSPGLVLPVLGSRGCAFRCSFCSIPFGSGSYRQRDVASVVAEMEEFSLHRGCKGFVFVDEMLSPRFLVQLSDRLAAREDRLYWYGETRASRAITVELARSMSRAGCLCMEIGLESYNQQVLDRMRKGTRLEVIDSTIHALLSGGVPVHLFCMLGFPGETYEEAQRTLSYSARVLRDSREVYGVQYSTRALSPFMLDALSEVAQSPESYGVDIVQPEERFDLAMDFSYEVDRGLDQVQAWRLASGDDPTSSLILIDDAIPSFWPKRAIFAPESEELVFLSAIPRNEEGVRSIGAPLGPSSSEFHLAPGKASWSKEVCVSRFHPNDIETFAVCQQDTGTILWVRGASLNVLRDLMDSGEMEVGLRCGLEELEFLALAGSLGLVTVSSCAPVRREAALMRLDWMIFEDRQLNRYIARSELTGDLLRLSAAGTLGVLDSLREARLCDLRNLDDELVSALLRLGVLVSVDPDLAECWVRLRE